MPNFLIYGANGYTGSLIAREAVRRGMRPVLAGRHSEKLAALAAELKLEHRVFALDAPAQVDEGTRGMGAVLNCAGPFVRTFKPMADGCLRNRAHYLDITGEVEVFESLARRDADAKAAGIVLMPGVGFDVVPTDCLAMHLKRRLPSATRLVLGFQSAGNLSRGTALTVLENMPRGGVVREQGVLKRVPAAWKTRTIDFGNGPAKAITIPWGDVATAFHSTGIPHIEVYMAVPWSTRVASRLSRWFGWLLNAGWVQRWMQGRIHAGAAGPTEAERNKSRCYVWGEASDDLGRTAVTRMQTPDGYDLTVQTSLAIVERVLGGAVTPGFHTPARAFGPDFILEIPGVSRTESPLTA